MVLPYLRVEHQIDGYSQFRCGDIGLNVDLRLVAGEKYVVPIAQQIAGAFAVYGCSSEPLSAETVERAALDYKRRMQIKQALIPLVETLVREEMS